MKNMSKYDTMIALNKKNSEEKVEKAKKAIYKMMDEGEKVTVPKLMQKTGLSRGFFYKNPIVRREIDRAMEQQVGMIDPKRHIGDMVLKNKIMLLEEQVRELKRENEQLKQEKRRLEKALDKRDLNFIKGL